MGHAAGCRAIYFARVLAHELGHHFDHQYKHKWKVSETRQGEEYAADRHIKRLRARGLFNYLMEAKEAESYG